MTSKPTPLSFLLSSQARALGLDSGDVRRLLAERGVYLSPQAVRYWHTGQTAPADAIRPVVADVYGITLLTLSRAAAGLVDSACVPDDVLAPGKSGGAGFPFNAGMYVVNGTIDIDRLAIDLPRLTGDQALDVLAEIAAGVNPTLTCAVDKNQTILFNME